MRKVNAQIIMIDKYSAGRKRVGTGYEVQIVEIIPGI